MFDVGKAASRKECRNKKDEAEVSKGMTRNYQD
jgi:hypothetical protein